MWRHLSTSCLCFFTRFYDEIGTPLLSDVRIEYTQDSVRYVTQRLFANYFNGSEIVVAGKLANRSAESLHVQVTASSSDKSIVLETDVPLRRREAETGKGVEAARAALGGGAGPPGSGSALGAVLGSLLEDFVERVWGFLSVKEGLRSQLRSRGSERAGLVQHATNLSLAYNFLSPVTKLVVESPNATVALPPTTPPPPNDNNEVPEDQEDSEGADDRPPSAVTGEQRSEQDQGSGDQSLM